MRDKVNENKIIIKTFHGQNLQGKSFKNQHLAGVDFSKADIHGSDFSGANLIGANFVEAKAGLTLKSKLILVFSLLFVIFVAGILTTFASFWLSFFFSSYSHLKMMTGIIFYLLLITLFLIVNIYKGLLHAVVIMPFALATVIPCVDILTKLGTGLPTAAAGGAGIAVATTIGIMLIVIAVTCTRVLTAQRVAVTTIIFTILGALVGVVVGKPENIFILFNPNLNELELRIKLAFVTALIVAASLPILIVYIAWVSFPKDKNSHIITGFAIAFATIGGTNFRNANLTEADFTQAILSSTNFQGANLTRTRWFQARKLEQSKLNGTILKNSSVINLLVNLKVNYKSASFLGLNLQGANLAGAELSYIDLTEADISEGTLAGANLEYANLTKTQAIRTNFQQTMLTGACLEAWNIDNTTELSNVICEYVYLLNNQRERRPSSGEFQPGDFTKLFQEVLNTVDLIFRNGIDWKAFAHSFNQLQVENEGAELSIRSIENKGDGLVVVRVDVPENADKSKIYSEFTRFYDTTTKILEEKYRGEIESKDKEIDTYRQHLVDLQKTLQIFEKQPINFHHRNKVVILKFGEGNFHTGFPVMLQIREETESINLECLGKLPPYPEIQQYYHNWQSAYRQSLNRVIQTVFPVNTTQTQITNIGKSHCCEECYQLAEKLYYSLNSWLNSPEFRIIKEQMLEDLSRGDLIRIIFQTQNETLQRLPWHLWDIFERYLKAEIAISNQAYRLKNNHSSASSPSKVRILVILADSSQLKAQKDKLYLQKLLQKAEIICLTNLTSQELQETLCYQKWDILYFSEHGFSNVDSKVGNIRINQTEILPIADLKYALAKTIKNGLKLAIFNFGDGFELA